MLLVAWVVLSCDKESPRSDQGSIEMEPQETAPQETAAEGTETTVSDETIYETPMSSGYEPASEQAAGGYRWPAGATGGAATGDGGIDGRWKKGLSLHSFDPPRHSCEELTFGLASLAGRLRSPDAQGEVRQLSLDYHRSGDGVDGVVTPEGQPWLDCAPPNRTAFSARPAPDSRLRVEWSCLAPDGAVVRSTPVSYVRGDCDETFGPPPQLVAAGAGGEPREPAARRPGRVAQSLCDVIPASPAHEVGDSRCDYCTVRYPLPERRQTGNDVTLWLYDSPAEARRFVEQGREDDSYGSPPFPDLEGLGEVSFVASDDSYTDGPTYYHLEMARGRYRVGGRAWKEFLPELRATMARIDALLATRPGGVCESELPAGD